MATTTLTQQQTAQPSISTVSVIRRIVPSLLEGAIPFAVYMLTKSTLHTSDVVALSIGALVPAILGVVRFVRSRNVDIMGMMILISLVGSIAAALIGGNPQILLIRESFMGALMGVAFLASMLLPCPLFFYLIRHFRAGRDAKLIAAFNEKWNVARMRRTFRIASVVWGLGLLGEFVLRVVFVYTLPIPVVLALSAIMFPAILIAMIAWTVWYLRRA